MSNYVGYALKASKSKTGQKIIEKVKDFFKPRGKKVSQDIKSTKPPVGSLTKRRKDTDEVFGVRSRHGVTPNKKTGETVKKISKINDNLDKFGPSLSNPKRPGKKDGGRMGLKFGSGTKRKTNVQKIKETFGPNKKVPNKFKGFSKLPEKVQQKIDAKLAKKV